MELIQYSSMIEFIQTVLALLVTISILVTIHEFGHYWVARLFNVHVIRFSVGFGKIIFSRKGPSPNIATIHEGVAYPVSRLPAPMKNLRVPNLRLLRFHLVVMSSSWMNVKLMSLTTSCTWLSIESLFGSASRL